MQKLIFLFAAVLFISCNHGPNKAGSENTGTAANDSSGFYFDYTIDGKEMHVAADDITCSYALINNKPKFTITTGKDEGVQLLLIIPRDMTKPSTTPSGSADYNLYITQGSLSLQNFPEKNYTSNSYNGTYPEKTPVIPDAIAITASEADADVARIITGSFEAKTYGDRSHDDPKNTDHVLKGKFRIRDEFTSYNGGKF